jgi:acyl-[acyl-carrier-protein]-phospholipid O-acyltransferase/long-chain-fatty-acid--[acyl-carrier-protein] ligase
MKTSLPTSFHWLNTTQFLGALNDNLFKQFVVFFLILALGTESVNRVSAMAGAIFAVPFLLFNNVAGVLADRHSKRTIIVATKVLEIGVMCLGLTGFWLHSPPLLYATIFMMSTQSALFGPSKYGIVPELVDRDRLSQANGQLVMWTYLAVILGTAFAPWIGETLGRRYDLAQYVCVGVAVAGVGACLGIRRTPAAGSTRGGTVWIVSDVWRTMRTLRGDRHLLLAVLASAYFSLIGAYMQVNLIPYGMQHLGLTQEKSGYLFFLAALGIACGAALAGRLSGRNIEFGIVPLGAVILTGASVALTFVAPAAGTSRGEALAAVAAAAHPAWAYILALHDVLAVVFVAGVGAGLFLIPVDAFVQFRAPRARMGEILAAGSWLGWLGVLLAAGLVCLNPVLHLTAAQGFLLMAVLTVVLTAGAMWVLPDFLLRFAILLLTRAAYRIRVLGRAHIPLEGPALLVCNHVSYMDALLLIATQQRRLRFMMGRDVFRSMWYFRPFFRLMGVIPISEHDSPRQLVAAIAAARHALDMGHMVAIFAEGALTRTGGVRAFRRGFERIVKGTTHPVIPVYIGGGWGSLWSYYHGRFVSRWPACVRYPVTVVFGAPLPAGTPPADVREAVLELSVAYFEDRRTDRQPLADVFVRTARAHWFDRALSDATNRPLAYGATLTRALALADWLRPRLTGQDRAAVCMAPSVEAALANLALELLGKTALNFNAAGGPPADVATVLAGREGDRVSTGGGRLTHRVHEILADLSALAWLRAWLGARFMPARWLVGRGCGRSPDDVAAVTFDGAAPGARLTHHGILSSVESLRTVLATQPRDTVCGGLPFHQPFGLAATLWLPLLSGLAVAYPATPLTAAGAARLARRRRTALLLATPAFLDACVRDMPDSAFGTLRLAIAATGNLAPETADAFERKFGVRPLASYGTDALLPATLSVAHANVGGMFQEGWRGGSIGLPLPGVAVRVVDPATGASQPPNVCGMLTVKGPVVLWRGTPATRLPTDPADDGWARTGDIARIDADGFVHLGDKAAPAMPQ